MEEKDKNFYSVFISHNWQDKKCLLSNYYGKILEQSNLYTKIKDFLIESGNLYPNIDEWWEKSVVPDLKANKRLLKIIFINGEVAGLSIAKRTRKSAKLCTLKVQDKYRRFGIGHQLLKSTVNDLVAKSCKNVHFTMSEEVMSQCNNFFTDYGFKLKKWKKNCYIKGMDELIFSGNIDELKMGVARQETLMSIRPKYAELIEKKEKIVEFRRKFSNHNTPINCLFYVTSPIKQIRFSALIHETVKAEPELLWNKYCDLGGVDKKSFFEYFEGTSSGNALLLSEIKPLIKPISLCDLKKENPSFKAPQSYKFIKEDDPICKMIWNQYK